MPDPIIAVSAARAAPGSRRSGLSIIGAARPGSAVPRPEAP